MKITSKFFFLSLFCLTLSLLSGCEYLVSLYLAPKQVEQAAIFIQSLDAPLQNFRQDIGRFPYTAEGLDALLECPAGVDPSKWDGPYIELKAARPDPWGMPYQYQFPGTRTPGKYDLWSFGPDMMDGTEDDIGNW